MIKQAKERIRKAKNVATKHITTIEAGASRLRLKLARQLRKAEQPCRQAWATVVKASKIVKRWATTVWTKHCDQVHNNSAYVAALAAAVTTVVELAVHDPATLTIVAAAVAVYLAIHHANNTDRYRPTDPWGDGGLSWR